MSGHVLKECTCGRVGCMFCDGGLAACTICGGLEGSLTTHCCQQRLVAPIEKLIHEGVIDFVDGRWIQIAREGQYAEIAINWPRQFDDQARKMWNTRLNPNKVFSFPCLYDKYYSYEVFALDDASYSGYIVTIRGEFFKYSEAIARPVDYPYFTTVCARLYRKVTA